MTREDAKEYAYMQENAVFSGLYVDEECILRKTNPDIGLQHFATRCKCCTYTFNGVPFKQPLTTLENSGYKEEI